MLQIRISWEKNVLSQTVGKWARIGVLGFFFNLLKNLVINFCWIGFVMEIYIICCVPSEQINEIADFLLLDRNSQKVKVEKVSCEHGQNYQY